MKTHRMSRSTEKRNATKAMHARGRASSSRAALHAPDQILTGRRFLRANRLTHAKAEALAPLARDAGERLRHATHFHLDEWTMATLGIQMG